MYSIRQVETLCGSLLPRLVYPVISLLLPTGTYEKGHSGMTPVMSTSKTLPPLTAGVHVLCTEPTAVEHQVQRYIFPSDARKTAEVGYTNIIALVAFAKNFEDDKMHSSDTVGAVQD